jgi:DNA-directed RNA polymerase specialized sigma24 family protein
MLVARGRLLFDRDPTEWSGASLEVLLAALRYAEAQPPGPWLRRQVAQQIGHRFGRIVRRELARYRAERACDPAQLPTFERHVETDPHPQLTDALEGALGRLDPASRAGLQAVARQLPLAPVADAHQLTHAALRQRLVRARRQLRPQLAAFAWRTWVLPTVPTSLRTLPPDELAWRVRRPAARTLRARAS